MNRVKALILAAGVGARLRPLTDHTAKCLVPVRGRCLLDYWVNALAESGVRECLINTHALRDQVTAYIDRVNQRGGMRLYEGYEEQLLGSAGTIAANREFAEDADQIVIIYADNVSSVDLDQLLAFHGQHTDPFSMLLFQTQFPSSCGIAELDDGGKIVSFVEKPAHPVSNLANAGVYVVDAGAYREIADLQAFDIGFDVLPKFVGRMRGCDVGGYHRDIGTPESYQQAQHEALATLEQKGYDAQGQRPAVFLDRDGTLIESVHYLSDPRDVRLIADVPGALRRLRQAGYALVVVSNQSAIGRGRISEQRLLEINDRMCRLFAEQGVAFDALYHCPVVPRLADRTVVEHSDRKPGPGLLQRAARELALDISRSWMIGDMISDALAGSNARCRGSILVKTGAELTPAEQAAASEFPAATTLTEAVNLIFNNTEQSAARRRSA